MNATNESAARTPRIRGNYGQDIVALAQELQRLRESSFDVVAAAKDLRAVAEEVTPEGVRRVALDVPGFGTYSLTRHGHEQLADKCGIPFRYYEAMRAAGMNDLVAANVNRWLGRQADRRLVRVADGLVRAVLSDRYRVLDNYDLAMMVMDRAREHTAMIQECDLTETRMYVKLVVPEFREAIKAGDDVVPGLIVSNSEVGDGAFRVEPFLFRLVCSNGLIGEDSLYKVHLGSRLEVGQLVFSDETRRLADAALWSQVRDVIDSTFDTKVLRALVEKLRATTQVVIEKPREVTDAVAKNLDLSDDKTADLIRYFAKEGDTVYGLVNGITRLAQDFDTVEDQLRLERYAGTLMNGAKVVA